MKPIWSAVVAFFKTRWGKITAVAGVIGFILTVLQYIGISPEPKPTPTFTPTFTPSPFIEKVELTDALPGGGEARVAVRTLPGSTCYISFLTPAGSKSTADALDFITADSQGLCRWNWKISKNTLPGRGVVIVRVGDLERQFTITILSGTPTPPSSILGLASEGTPAPTPALPEIFDEFECVPRDTFRQAGVVESVVDGNTIEVRVTGGELLRVRYLGVDTPGEGHPWAAESKSINERMMIGQPVILVKDQLDADPQGNLLRYVFTPDTFVNFRLVRSGYGYTSSDPCSCTDMFIEMEMAASESEAGFSDLAALGPDFSGHPLYDYHTPTP